MTAYAVIHNLQLFGGFHSKMGEAFDPFVDASCNLVQFVSEPGAERRFRVSVEEEMVNVQQQLMMHIRVYMYSKTDKSSHLWDLTNVIGPMSGVAWNIRNCEKEVNGAFYLSAAINSIKPTTQIAPDKIFDYWSSYQIRHVRMSSREKIREQSLSQ